METSRRVVASVLAVSVALICVTVGLAIRSRDQSRAINDLRRDLEARVTERSNVDGVIAANTLMEAARVRNSWPAQPASVPPAPGPDSQPRASEEKPKATLDDVGLKERFSAMFAEEPVNPVWAQERKATLSSRFQVALPSASVLKGIECHSALCRVETVHQDSAGYHAFLDSAFRDPGTKVTTGGVFATLTGKDEEGRLVATVFVAAEGESLPRPDVQ